MESYTLTSTIVMLAVFVLAMVFIALYGGNEIKFKKKKTTPQKKGNYKF